MKKLFLICKSINKSFVIGSFLSIILFFVACHKNEDNAPTKTNATDSALNVSKSNVSAEGATLGLLTSSDGSTIYDYDKYGQMVYNHAKYFNGTFDPYEYLPKKGSEKFRAEFPAYIAQQNALYPTLQTKLDAYVAKKVYSEKSKNLILNYDQDLGNYLNSSDNLTFQEINNFILNKENAVINDVTLTDSEKMSLLPLSSITRRFIELKYEAHLNYLKMNPIQSRGDCPWYKLASCINTLIQTGITAYGFASQGAIIGGSIGIGFGPIGLAAGGIIGGTLGAAVGVIIKLSSLIDCYNSCFANPPTPTPTPTTLLPCSPATSLGIKIKGCGLTQTLVCTGQGSSVNNFVGPVSNATVTNIISTVPTFPITQVDPTKPVTISISSGCSNTAFQSIGIQEFNIAELVGDPGFVDIIGSTQGCLKVTDCYELGGSFLNNSNNIVKFVVPPSSNYTATTNPDGSVCVRWKEEGTYTFYTEVKNACSGKTKITFITVEVKPGLCE